MKKQSRAGEIRKGARTIIRDGIEASVGDGVAISDDVLETLARIAVNRESKAMVEMPLAAVSVCCHALSYLRNNPTLDGVLKFEADQAYSVMVFIADDMHPGAAEAFAQIDAEFARQSYDGGKTQ
jgi:hypothetical protein